MVTICVASTLATIIISVMGSFTSEHTQHQPAEEKKEMSCSPRFVSHSLGNLHVMIYFSAFET